MTLGLIRSRVSSLMPLSPFLKRSLDAAVAAAMRTALPLTGLGDGPRHHLIEVTLEAIEGMNRGLGGDYLQFDPVLLWSLKPHGGAGAERADERGMMNGPFAMAMHPEARPVRVLIAGASLFIEGSPTLFRLVRERLESDRPDIELINAAVPGYTAVQVVHHLDRLFPFYRPTHVFACTIWTDCWPRHLLDDPLALRIMSDPPWRGGLAAERLGRAFLYARWRLRHHGPRVPLNEYRRLWRFLIRYCRARGCQPLFFTLPIAFDIPPMHRYLRLHRLQWLPERYARYMGVFRAVTAGHPICDCSCALTGGAEQYFESDGQHLNALGKERVADLMADFFLKNIPDGAAGRSEG
ncbi:MAG: hypothetical protein Kow0059_15060 [Candidatus Sumerlaeia bacterium]